MKFNRDISRNDLSGPLPKSFENLINLIDV